MPTYTHVATYDAPVEDVWAWYDSPGAFRRIMPEWEGIKPLEAGRLVNDATTRFRVSLGPLRPMWVARHYDVVAGEVFNDVMEKGPFGAWDHEHRFVPTGDNTSEIRDTIQWKLPFHPLTFWTAPFTVKGRMNQMFAYRTHRVQEDLRRIAQYADLPKQRVLVSGSTGLIGLQLCAFLQAAGHEVVRLTRPSTVLPPDVTDQPCVVWDDQTGEVLEGSLEGFDTVIHLAGAGIGDKRWNAERKALIRSSRTVPTENLVRLFSTLETPPKTFLSGSAVGYYGNRGDEQLTESSPAGDGFLSQLAQDWEAAAAPAQDLGIRTVWMRTGIITTPMGGALQPMLLPTLLGAGGPLGGGRQYQSWISLHDHVYATYHLMMTESCEGAYNLTAPEPVMQKHYAKTLGKVLLRPWFAPAPGFVLRIMFGELAQALILDGQRVLPQRVLDSGFVFSHEGLESCLRECLGKQKSA
ncbi:MAG: TIGR01777 family oxidoreductase [Candidatus Thermoplasmatota archaeon]